MTRLLFESRAAVLACEAQQALIEKEIELEKLKQQRNPLTDEEISDLWDGHVVPVFGKNGINPIVFARAIEAKLKEKNK